MENPEVDHLFVAFHQLKQLFHYVPPSSEVAKGEFVVLNNIRLLAEQVTIEQGIRLSSLCKKTHISKSGISQMLRSLEKKGFIMRSVDEKDRRAVFVHLTSKGIEYLEERNQILFEKMEQVIEKMGKEDIDLFLELTDHFSDAVREVFYGASPEHIERVEK